MYDFDSAGVGPSAAMDYLEVCDFVAEHDAEMPTYTNGAESADD